MKVIGAGQTDSPLSGPQVQEVIARAAAQLGEAGERGLPVRVLAVIPDHTRTCPLPEVMRMLHRELRPRVARLDALIALGTHPPMSEEQIDRLLGVPPGRRGETFGDMRVFNHRWDDESALVNLGALTAEQVREITGGLSKADCKLQIANCRLKNRAGLPLRGSICNLQSAICNGSDVDVKINKLVLDYDVLLVVGPVFPHEVAGFSGGSKYFFPGVSGPELLNFFHWLGAVITSPRIIGVKDTPVRATIEAAADMIPREKFALCMVTAPIQEKGAGKKGTGSAGCLAVPVPFWGGADDTLAGVYFGPVAEAWSSAADLSQKLHITYLDRPVESVLSQAPPMYDELWVAAKCMYKLESVVADGGELIIYAPHLSVISATHGRLIEEIGYHTRDYFLAQWEKFGRYPRGVLAHSTHLRGAGTMEGGIEKPRIRVTLASAIPEALCRKVNLGYLDPRTIDVRQWQGRADRLYVPKAGEMLYRLKEKGKP
jgi:nickel-dependent lactate racemase